MSQAHLLVFMGVSCRESWSLYDVILVNGSERSLVKSGTVQIFHEQPFGAIPRSGFP